MIVHGNILLTQYLQRKIFSWPKYFFYCRFSTFTQQKIWERFANNFQLYRKSATKCFLPSSMKAAKQMNKITSNNFLINVYHYWGFSKENGRFPIVVCHALQRIRSWKSSTNSSWEKSCVLNTIIFLQSTITFSKKSSDGDIRCRCNTEESFHFLACCSYLFWCRSDLQNWNQ